MHSSTNGNGSGNGNGNGAAHCGTRRNRFMVGLDVGSTTVKALVIDAPTGKILWQDYQRHETKQPEKTLEFLRRMEKEVGINSRNTRMFMTGSGGDRKS